MHDPLTDAARQRLDAFLAFDIQDSREWASELIAMVEAVRTGQRDRWERLGNVYQLDLTPTAAHLMDLVDEESAIETIDIDLFYDACYGWLLNLGGAIATTPDPESPPPPDRP